MSTAGGLITTCHSTNTPYMSTAGKSIATSHNTVTPYTSTAEITTSHMTTAPYTCTAGITTSSITSHTASVATSHAVTAASSTEQEAFYATLNLVKVKPAILKLISPYSKFFIPVQTLPTFPKLITELCDNQALLLTYSDVLTKCEKVFDSIKV